MTYSLFSTFIISIIAITCVRATLPDYIHVCHRNDPQVSKCILKAVEVLRPRLISGIPELDVPPIEPLILPEIVISRGGENTNYRAVGKNVRAFGLGNFQATKLKMDIPNLTFIVGVKFPFLHFLADIDVDVKILVVPIKGQGTLDANATNVFGNIILEAEVLKDNGVERFHFKNIDLNLKMDEVDVHVENIFAGDPVVGESINRALHENRNVIFQVIKPIAEGKVTEIVLNMANNISKHFDYNEVFPE